MKKAYSYRMTAKQFTEDTPGMIGTVLFGDKATQTVQASSFDELDEHITTFGTLHAPCNVWVTCTSKPSSRGFDRWNSNSTRNLFRAPPKHDPHSDSVACSLVHAGEPVEVPIE